MTNVGVLASGRGSNFRAIVEHKQLGIFNNVDVRLLIYNYSEAPVAQIAEKAGIPSRLIDHRERSRQEFETDVMNALEEQQVDLVCLAGWDRIVGSEFFNKYRWRAMNIHPALLPAFGEKGLNARFVHEAVLQYGAKVTGCTVYFIDISVEKGPIILQKPVEVREKETALFSTDTDQAVEILSNRVLIQEHRLYSKAIQLYADGRLHVNEFETEQGGPTRKVTFLDIDDKWEKDWTRRQQRFIEHQARAWASNPSITEEGLR